MPEAVLSGLILEAVCEKCFHLIFMHQKGLLHQLIHSLAVGMYLCPSDGPAVYLYMAVADLEGANAPHLAASKSNLRRLLYSSFGFVLISLHSQH